MAAVVLNDRPGTLYMNDLEAVARDLRLSVDTLKLPAELLNQGYDPSFLATYRPDELGQMDATILARLKRGLDRRARLASYKQHLCTQGTAEGWWQSSLDSVVDSAQSIAEVDGLTRNIRSRKSTRILAAKNPRLAELGQAILTMTDAAPADLVAWVGEKFAISSEEAKQLLDDTKHWLQVLLSEDAPLLHRLGRQILKRGQLSIKLLAEQVEREAKDKAAENSKNAEHQGANNSSPTSAANEPTEHSDEEESLAASYSALDAEPHAEVVHEELAEMVSADALHEASPIVESHETSAPTAIADVPVAESILDESTPQEISAPETAPLDPLLAAFPTTPASKIRTSKLDKKPTPKAPQKQLSPRQRRRKWLRSILQRYSKMRTQLTRIGHYQALMLGRGQRSQIVSIKIDYDRQAMTQMAREALCPGPHPLNSLLMEVSEEALQKIILSRLEHDVFAEIEEVAHHELTEMAVRHLQDMLQQRPVRGHRILVIDAMGPKTAAVAIVDPNGHVDFTGELSAVSSRADVVAQNVATLGQWIHQYRVSLVAVSNGNTRRYLIHTVAELMKQSSSTDLRWTLVDRTGADAYCDTRQALQELPKIAKRFRAAVWLGWRLQDPLIELTKVDPARLRLGSYQRELPQDILETALLQAVSASVAARGIDVWHSHEKALVCLPGVTTSLAKAITALRDSEQISTREKLVESLRESATETQLRQAIGYLRVFGSEQPLDATTIHPNDYRLAERLIAAGPLTAPPAAPDGWRKPIKQSAKVAPPVTAEAEAETHTAEESAGTSGTTSDASIEPVAEMPPAAEESIAPSEENSATTETVADADADANAPSEVSAESTSEVVVEATPKPAEAPKSPLAMETIHPQNPTEPELAPPLSIDVERLARSWQVGREKLRVVARSLQQPFVDSRDSRVPVPLLSQVPTLDSLKPGLAAWGIVVGVADFGAFVDLGPDCNGLIHVSRLSREFVEDPHEIVQIGDLLQVWVVHVDLDKKRVALSALPPGTESARRPSNQDAAHEGSSQSPANNRGFRGDRPNASRPGGQTQERRPQSQGQRQGQDQGQRGQSQGQGQGQGGRGPNPQGSNQRGSNDRGQRRDRYERREDSDRSTETTSRSRAKPSQPAPPITEAMQTGQEPLRSFSDLLQFYQTKREEPSKPETPPAVTPTTIPDQAEPKIEETESNPNA